MKIELTREKVHNEFTKKVELISGQNLFACYQCGNCTAGCPVAFAMEMGPHEVIRHTLLGLEEEVARSEHVLAVRLLSPVHIEMPKGDRYRQGDGCPEDGDLEEEGEKRPHSDSRVSGGFSGKGAADRFHQRLP